jgi:hypothetical protein
MEDKPVCIGTQFFFGRCDMTLLEPIWYGPQGKIYITTAELPWSIGSIVCVTVPIGYVFDMSVPKPVRWLVDPDNPLYLKAACLHDYTLYKGWDRILAAALFADALKQDGVGRFKRLVMTLSVIIWKFR